LGRILPCHSTDQMTAASAVMEFSCVCMPADWQQSRNALITGLLFNAHWAGK
jgi:hypothetical protein